jgi:hypothetical protein
VDGIGKKKLEEGIGFPPQTCHVSYNVQPRDTSATNWPSPAEKPLSWLGFPNETDDAAHHLRSIAPPLQRLGATIAQHLP